MQQRTKEIGFSKSHGSRRFALPAAIAIASIGLFDAPASAAKAIDVINQLYGGNGIQLDAGVNANHSPHFDASGIAGLGLLGSNIAQNVNSITIGAGISSFVYDLEEAVFVRDNDSLGPLIAERANTIGKNYLNFGWNYSRVEFRHFEGDSLNDLELLFAHEAGGGFDDEVIVDIDIKLEQDIVQLFGAWGITSNWDVGLILPIVISEFSVVGNARVNRVDSSSTTIHVFCDDPDLGTGCSGIEDPSVSRGKGNKSSIGDIKLRTKWHFLESDDDGWTPDAAFGGEIKVPTGDEDNFLGTGETHFTLMGIGSKKIGNFNPHANLGFEFATDSDFNQFRYVVGVDTALTKQITLAVDVIGRSLFERNEIDPDIVSLGVGAKVNPWKKLVLIGNIIVPLNPSKGLRPNLTWTIGSELTF